MNCKSKNYQIIISILAVVLNLLVSAFAYSFVGSLGLSFAMRWFIGFLIICSPMFTTWAVIALWKKEKARQKE